jgi:hypothetical protein
VRADCEDSCEDGGGEEVGVSGTIQEDMAGCGSGGIRPSDLDSLAWVGSCWTESSVILAECSMLLTTFPFINKAILLPNHI